MRPENRGVVVAEGLKGGGGLDLALSQWAVLWDLYPGLSRLETSGLLERHHGSWGSFAGGRWETSEEAFFYGMREMKVPSKHGAKGKGMLDTLDMALDTPHSSALFHLLNSWVTWG